MVGEDAPARNGDDVDGIVAQSSPPGLLAVHDDEGRLVDGHLRRAAVLIYAPPFRSFSTTTAARVRARVAFIRMPCDDQARTQPG